MAITKNRRKANQQRKAPATKLKTMLSVCRMSAWIKEPVTVYKISGDSFRPQHPCCGRVRNDNISQCMYGRQLRRISAGNDAYQWKSFPALKALDNVNLRVRPHSVHALMGENGAGKSHIIKMPFSGFIKRQRSILFQGQEIDFKGSKRRWNTACPWCIRS